VRANYHRPNYNRQTRRAARCVRAPSPRGNELAISPRRLALTAYGHDLAQVAARIADGLELSADVIDHLLSPVRSAAAATVGSQPTSSRDGWALERAPQASSGVAPGH
jgi:hypothetical protein